jgi:hypothetical protein
MAGAAVTEAVEAVWRSASSEAALAYRRRMGVSPAYSWIRVRTIGIKYVSCGSDLGHIVTMA